jgi:hypothetical protein
MSFGQKLPRTSTETTVLKLIIGNGRFESEQV